MSSITEKNKTIVTGTFEMVGPGQFKPVGPVKVASTQEGEEAERKSAPRTEDEEARRRMDEMASESNFLRKLRCQESSQSQSWSGLRKHDIDSGISPEQLKEDLRQLFTGSFLVGAAIADDFTSCGVDAQSEGFQYHDIQDCSWFRRYDMGGRKRPYALNKLVWYYYGYMSFQATTVHDSALDAMYTLKLYLEKVFLLFEFSVTNELITVKLTLSVLFPRGSCHGCHICYDNSVTEPEYKSECSNEKSHSSSSCDTTKECGETKSAGNPAEWSNCQHKTTISLTPFEAEWVSIRLKDSAEKFDEVATGHWFGRSLILRKSPTQLTQEKDQEQERYLSLSRMMLLVKDCILNPSTALMRSVSLMAFSEIAVTLATTARPEDPQQVLRRMLDMPEIRAQHKRAIGHLSSILDLNYSDVESVAFTDDEVMQHAEAILSNDYSSEIQQDLALLCFPAKPKMAKKRSFEI
ncbi:hypothetical protein HDE_11122 [Halotydeus destructor]|nr:hypothetical protein HDE_11122 [Halotydeus destructor]